MYKQLCMDRIYNSSVIYQRASYPSRWGKHYGDDYWGGLNTARFTGKPADIEGKMHPGSRILGLHPLNLKKADVGVVPDGRVHVARKQSNMEALKRVRRDDVTFE